MYMTCKCLNVSIKTRGSELRIFNEDDVKITNSEKADPFFRENLAMALELEGINKEQGGLVESRNVGSWVVNRCNNCSTFTHAVHREHGAALVLINTNIVMSCEEIEKLRASSHFSSIYRLIVDHNAENTDLLEAPTKYSVSQLSNNLQLALTNIHQQLEQAVQKKSLAIEEKIRAFTAEQYQLLEQYREQAHTEHRLLARIICNRESKAASNVNLKTSSPQKIRENFVPSPEKRADSTTPIKSDETGLMTGSNIRHHAATKHPANIVLNGGSDKKDRRLKPFPNDPDCYDAEVLFPLEGMDDMMGSDNTHASSDESDTDDSGQDEGIHIPRNQRGGHPTLAKSLPVSVPNFSSFVRRSVQDQDDDQLSRDPLDPNNIRASMKALAKSVHGDTVFGDLPRPRFSTQI